MKNDIPQQKELSRLSATIANWLCTALVGVLVWSIQDWKGKVETHLKELRDITTHHGTKLAIIETKIEQIRSRP